MTRIWNPYTFTPLGNPIVGEAPPVLRVLGGMQATAQQLSYAQQRFTQFVMQARLSAAPNPTEAGRLPDGTQYRIVVVGPQTIMEIWPGGEEDDRLSGIGLRLTTLSGGLVPGHTHADGLSPQSYILTPKVKRGTRNTTGKWRVRKVEDFSGGKAVWGDKAGKRFFAGVDGQPYDIDILEWMSLEEIFGTNNRAYRVGEFSAGDQIYTGGGKGAGVFRAPSDTVPFTHRDNDGRLWIMQITPVTYPDAKLQLWGQIYDGSAFGHTIGDLLGEVAIPAGYLMIWQTISVAPDGKAARMVFRKVSGNMFAKVDLGISPAGISIVGMADAGSYTPPTSNTVNTGNQIEGPFTSTTVAKNGWFYMPGGYGYDAKGAGTAFDLRYGFGGYDRNTSLVEFRVRQGDNLQFDEYILRQVSRQSTSREVFPGLSIDYGNNRTVSFDGGDETVNATFLEVDETWWDPAVSGSGRRRVRRTGVSTLTRHDDAKRIVFVDPTTDLYVTAHYKHTGINVRTTDYTYNEPPGDAAGTVDNTTVVNTHTYARGLTATCRGKEVLSVIVPLPDSTNWTQIQYVALSATDPLTGAVCVNILELDYAAGAGAPPLRSWILLADDQGAKLLHDVLPNVPQGTGIRVQKDYSLLSVP